MKNCIYFILTCFILFSNRKCFSQNASQLKVDSLKNLLNTRLSDTAKIGVLLRVSGFYAKTEPDTCLDYAQKAMKLIDLKWKKVSVGELKVLKEQKIKAYIQIGSFQSHNNDFDNATNSFNSGLELCREINDLADIAIIDHNFGQMYKEKGNFPEATKLLLEASKINEALGNKNFLWRNFNALGLVSQEIRNYNTALKYFDKAINILKELGDLLWVAKIEANKGNVYFDQANYKEALISNKACLAAYLKYGKDSAGIADCYDTFGNTYRYMENFKEGLKFAEIALNMRLRFGKESKIASSYLNVGGIYIDLKEYKKAIDYIEKAKAIKIKLGDRFALLPCYGSLSEAYANLGDYKQAFHYHKLLLMLKDSTVNETSNAQINEMEVKYETEKKDKELTKRESQIKEKDALAKQKTTERNAFIGGFVLMIGLAFFIFRGFKEKQKANKTITEQKLLVELKQKEILDSISYAKRLQDAILPPLESMNKVLPNNFVFYQPKDIVAGDFYWMESIGSTVFLAAADCTGHGVPGAMVSIVCSNALNRTVKEFGITEPGKILDKVRELVIETFEKSSTDVKDGMDISICAIKFSSNNDSANLKWSGANNPLWYIQNHEMKEIKSTKQPIGKSENPVNFVTHTIDLKKGDSFYLFTDGFADQFGGEKGKKFKYKKLQQFIFQNAGLPQEEQSVRLRLAFENWKGKLEQVDDILIIGVSV
jgi:serine phosphatase RsbU (regulator of sigma subunit)